MYVFLSVLCMSLSKPGIKKPVFHLPFKRRAKGSFIPIPAAKLLYGTVNTSPPAKTGSRFSYSQKLPAVPFLAMHLIPSTAERLVLCLTVKRYLPPAFVLRRSPTLFTAWLSLYFKSYRPVLMAGFLPHDFGKLSHGFRRME